MALARSRSKSTSRNESVIRRVAWVAADDRVDRLLVGWLNSQRIAAIVIEYSDGAVAVINRKPGMHLEFERYDKWKDVVGREDIKPKKTSEVLAAPAKRRFEEDYQRRLGATRLKKPAFRKPIAKAPAKKPVKAPSFESTFESIAVAASPAAATPLPASTVTTSLHGIFEGHDLSQPLEVDHDYVFAFWASDIPTKGAIVFDATDLKFEEGQTSIKLTIQLLGADFEIQQPSQELFIGRDGKSRGKARFDVRTKRAGASTLEALILRDGNFVQKLTIAINVGTAGALPVGEISTVGRAFTADERVQPREVVILMQKEGDALRFIATKDGAISGRLKITDQQLDNLVSGVRTQLQEVVETFDDASGSFIYQAKLDIPKEIHERALRKLAKAGAFLFKTLFAGPGSDDGMKAIGRLLQKIMAAPEPLDVQIVTERFYFPWSLLYVTGKPVDPPDAQRFLGFAHRVEEVALQSHDARPPEIRHDENLQLGVYVNKSIDDAMSSTYVEDQIAFFDTIEKTNKAKVATRDKTDVAMQALSDANVPDQLMYFYCHARSGAEGDTALELEKDKSITLVDLRLNAPDDPFRSTPLVFINACQSAMLSPLFYDGFIPELMSRGARGVIGTECDTPAIFAAAWAKRFLRDFLNGKELGKAVFDLRRDFLEKEHNLMGLLYAVHCNGNTRVDPSLGLTTT